MVLPLKDHEYHTYGDYLQWPGGMRYELLDGIAYLMSPAPTVSHQEIVGGIYFQVRLALEDKPCRVLIAPVDVRLPKGTEADEKIDTVVQPDVLVVCDTDKISERGVRGAPDWVVEVLSPASASHDLVKKREIYEQHGVKEYWLVHPTDRVLTIYRLDGDEFGKPDVQELSGDTPVGILPGVVITWDAIIERLPQSG